MAQVKFYRGAAGVSLPAHEEGAIFFVERENNKGDLYVDVENAKRLHIVPDSPITILDAEDLSISLKSKAGQVYYITKNANPPVIKIGDGKAYVIDLPTYPMITEDDKTKWDQKVDAFLQTEIDPVGSDEVLVLTRDYYPIG